MEDKPREEEIRLADGTMFSIGGVQSNLIKLVEADKIDHESVVFSIGPASDYEPHPTDGSQTDAINAAVGTAEESESRSIGHRSGDERYHIEREIARGGMGSILKAEDLDLRRFVAMKVLLVPGKVSSAMCERFVKEAQVTGFLEHPNIVPVHELGIDENARPFFTMKLIEGESLGSVLDELRNGNETYRSSYPLRRLLDIYIQVCNAVSFAHARGVIHRDLKPDNIMVGRFGEVLVMDWGLSRIRGLGEVLAPYNMADPDDYNQTQEGAVIGTPPYMPPEQATGRIDNTDERSDVFSLGAILYEIITKKRLYRGSSIGEIISKAAATKFDPPSSIVKVSADLERICMKALHESKEHRFQSVEAFSDELKAYLDHRVIPSYAVKTWQKIVQSLGVVAFFFFLIPATNVSGIDYILSILSIPSVIMVIGTAMCFQIIVTGWRTSFFGKLRRNTDSVAGTQGSIELQEGAYWGGLLGFIAGNAAVIGNFGNDSLVGAQMALALTTTLYFFGFYIVFRLDSIRELRRNSLFDAIAENSFTHLVRYAIILVLPIVALFLINVLLGTGDILTEGRLILVPGFIPTYPIVIYMLAIGFSLMYCRFVFTFKEMIAAFEHVSAYLAGNEVSPENRIHAAAVIRMLAETFMLTIAISVALIEIKFLADIVDTSEVLPSMALLTVVGGIAFLLYVIVNYLFVPQFLGYRAAAEDRKRMSDRTAAYVHESHGAFWTESGGGKAALTLASIGFFGLFIMALLTSGARFSTPVAFAFAADLLVFVYANLKRRRLKRIYKRNIEANSTVDSAIE